MPPRLSRPRNGASASIPACSRERSLQRLQHLAVKVLQDAAGSRNVRLSQAELECAGEDLNLLDRDVGLPGVWAAYKAECRGGLVALYALVLRRSCPALDSSASEGIRAVCTTLRSTLSQGLLRLLPDTSTQNATNGQAVSLLRAVLRSHTLRCYSILLSDAVTQLAQRPNARMAQTVHGIVQEVRCILLVFGEGILTDVWELKNEFLNELRDSNLLDHWARGLLLLAGYEDQERNVTEELLSVSRFLLNLSSHTSTANFADSPCLAYLQAAHMVQLAAELDGGPAYGLPQVACSLLYPRSAAHARFGALLDSQLVQWGVSGWEAVIRQARSELRAALQRHPGLAAVPGLRGLPGVSRAERGGQPSTGGQEDAEAADESVCTGHSAGEGSGAERLPGPAVASLHAALATDGGGSSDVPPEDSRLPPEVRRWLRCAALPPLNTRAAFEVAMRLAAAAFDAMPPASGQRAAGRTASDRMVWQKSQAAALAVRALRCAREACRDEAAAAGAVASRAVRGRLGRFWSLLLSTVERAQCIERPDLASYVPPGERWSFLELHRTMMDMSAPDGAAEELPAVPSPDVAAALSIGYVIRAEHMLRRVELRGSHMLLLRAPRHARDSAAWPQLLAFAPLRDTLSLLATAAKRARRAEQEPRTLARYHLTYVFWAQSVELLLSTHPLRWLRRLAEVQRGSAALALPTGGGAGAPVASGNEAAADVAAGGPRLCVAVSFIALLILPPLFRVVPELVARCSDHYLNRYYLTVPLLGWVPLLAAARLTSSWGADLLFGPEWNLAGLLGAAMGQVLLVMMGTTAPGMEGLRPALAAALRALAALAPGLLAEALPAAEALAEAVAAGEAAHDLCLEVRKGGGEAVTKARVPPLSVLRRVLGDDGGAPESMLLSELERLTEAGARGSGGSDSATVESAPGGGAAAVAQPEAVAAGLPAELRDWASAAALLVPPATLSQLLPLCDNPGCANLAGPSERELELSVVATCGCGAPRGRYCSETCRTARLDARLCCSACGATS